MANELTIDIYLKGGEDKQTSGNGANIKGMSTSDSTASGTTPTENKGIKQLGKYVASQTIDVFINNVKGSVSQNIGMITGRTELQQRISFGLSVAQQGVNTYKNAVSGSLITAGLGLGGGVGAVLGVALSAVSYGINLAFKQQQLDIASNLEGKQINQTLSRYGAGFNRSRRGV